MNGRATVARRFLLISILAALLPLGSCGSGGGNGGDDGDPIPDSLGAAFSGSGMAAAPNRVRLTAGTTSGDTVAVKVAISGQTTSSDIYSFAFDLLLEDPTVAVYLNNTADFGTALILGSGQGHSVLASENGDRVVVGVTKTGGGSGNGIGTGEKTIVTLTFRVLKEGATGVRIVGSPGNPQNPTNNPAALDSTGAVIGTITFDSAAAQIRGT